MVFNKYNTIEHIPEGLKLLGRGMDFGYNSPTAFVEVYKDGDTLYIKELLFVRGMTMPDIIHRLEGLGIDKTDTIWCDSASPQNIQELKSNRWNAKPVNKRSILHGIDLIRRHHIFIESNSKNILQEFGSYRFKEDKDGNLLDTPEDDNNHTIDAIRYILESELNKKKGGRKTSIVSYEERIPEAMEMMLYEKLNFVEFREQGAKKWNISERAAADVWSNVKDRLKARFDEKSDEIIEAQLQRYFDLLRRARADGNKRVEREVLSDLNKLYGLEIKKVDVTSQGEKVSININLTD
jgi:hypothetical protein